VRRAGLLRLAPLLAALALSPSPVSPAPAAKPKKVDLIWSNPRLDSLGIKSVALLPASSFDHNRQNERLVETLLAQSLKPTGYRWVTPSDRHERGRAIGTQVGPVAAEDEAPSLVTSGGGVRRWRETH